MVRIRCARTGHQPAEIERSVLNQLTIIERHADLTMALPSDSGPERWQDRLHHQTGQRVGGAGG